ncbi:MAG TPA: sigma-54 dependent transcriptional regulator [Candidatus Deferrimicrobiaceae bacterium]
MSGGRKRILVVDDEPAIVSLLATILREKGWDVSEAGSGTEGIDRLERGRYDVILTDLVMPGDSGIDLLRAAKEIHPDVEVILMTGYATADTAIEAMRGGAFHYLVKPLKIEEMLNLAEKAFEQRRLTRENQFLKAEIRGDYQIQSVVGDSEAIGQLVGTLQGLASTGDPVLLVGERGTGRSFFARLIHFNSPRSAGLFVPVYCAGAPEGKLSAELFGQPPAAGERNLSLRTGKVEMANHGTLYLSDLGEAGPRVLERLEDLLASNTGAPGSGREAPADIRLVASTAVPPEELGRNGKVPPSLLRALEPGTVRIPPLRERSEDVPILLHHFLREANRERKKPLRGFTPASLSILEPYEWPGNVRELRDLVRAVAAKKRQGTMVDASDIPPEIIYRRLRKKAPA